MVPYFPRLINEEDNKRFCQEISKEELLTVTSSFKDRSPSLDEWTIEFYLAFFDLLGDNLLKVVEVIRLSGKVWSFIALIPKFDYPETYDGFRVVSLCNCIYKNISKVIAVMLKEILSQCISFEQSGFLEGRLIHEAVGTAQEGLHTIKVTKSPTTLIKLDFSKAYDRVSWLYLHLLLIHVVFLILW